MELTDIDGEYLIELPQNYTVVLESITVPENFTAEVLKETYFPIVAFPYDADYELEVSCDDTGIAEVAKEDYVTVTGKAYGQAHITVTAGDFTKVCTVQVVPYKLSGYEWSKAMSDLAWKGNFTMFRTENGGEMYTIKSYNGLYDVKTTYGDEEKIYGFDAEYNDEGYSGYYGGKLYCILKPITPMEGVADDEALVFYVEESPKGPPYLKIETDEHAAMDVFEEYYDLLERST